MSTWAAAREIVEQNPAGSEVPEGTAEELADGLRDAAAWLRDGPRLPTMENDRGWIVAWSAAGQPMTLTPDGSPLVSVGRNRWEAVTDPSNMALMLRRVAEVEWTGGPLA